MKFNFPSGRDLARLVVELLGKHNSEQVNILRALNYSPDAMKEFREALLYSGKASVDAFLEHRDALLDVGKAAIACCLIPFEKKEQLFHVGDNWYQHLYGALNCKVCDFAANALGVVTFNYDRSLEFYLHTCLANTYGLSESQAADLLKHIPIVHVHGSLGRLPWQSGKEPARSYSSELTPDDVAAARDSIHVIHEDRYDDPSLQRARDLINDAETVVFLGFGYHGPNVERLQIDLSRNRRYFGGTAFGLKELERSTVQRSLKEKINLGLEHWDVLEFLRQRVELE